MISFFDIKDIAKAGSDLTVSAEDFTALNLKEIAEEGKASGAKLHITHAKKLISDCVEIAMANPGNVSFDFSE